MSIVLNNREINWELAYQINDNKYYDALLKAHVYPPSDILRKFRGNADYPMLDKLIRKICEEGNVKAFKEINFSKLSSYYFDIAAINGNLDLVKYFKETNLGGPLFGTSYRCLEKGHIEIAKYICQNWPYQKLDMDYIHEYLPEHKREFQRLLTENSIVSSETIYKACKKGDIKAIKEMNLSKLCTGYFYVAAINGNLDLVKYLKETNLAEPDITVSYQCIKRGHIEVAKYICQNWPDKCVEFFVMNYVYRHAQEYEKEFRSIFKANKFLDLKKLLKNN